LKLPRFTVFGVATWFLICASIPPARGASTPEAPAIPVIAALDPPLGTSDGRRTGEDFVKNLGRNSVGIFDHDNLGPFLVGLGATGAATVLDDDCERVFGGARRAKWLGESADVIGGHYVIVPAAACLYAAGRWSDGHQRFRDWTYDLGQVTLITVGYTMAIKFATRRLRPDGSKHDSFPSGHTANAFAWAYVADHYGGAWMGAGAYATAGLIGIGRMERNAHHLSDVVGGAALGYIVSRTVVRKNGDAPSGATAASSSARAASREPPMIGILVRF